MNILVLGSFEVRANSQRVQLGGPQRRSLLGVLTAHANTACSPELLIDALWGEHPPGAAAKLLQGLVARLRQVLEPEGRGQPQVIVTEPGGYRLMVGPAQLDSFTFEQLIDDARRAREVSDRAASLHRALALWRGEAYAGLRHLDTVHPESVRLDELRLSTLESWADALLDLGRHDELVATLEATLLDHPLREGLWQRLMLALYRQGRQADALRAYQRVRQRLADELGLEPGPELRELEAAILTQRASLRPGPSGHAAGVGVPAVAHHGPVTTTATVLVTDLVGSTGLRVALGDREADAVQAALDRAIDAKLVEHGGQVIKHLGDGTMAVFAAASDAVVASLALHGAISEIAPRGEPVSLRTGLSAGDISVAGGDVAGLPVVAATRLCADAPAGGVLCSELVRSLAGSRVDATTFFPFGRIPLKGLPEPVLAWLIEAGDENDVPFRSLPVPLVSARGRPFVGRAHELDRLRSTIEVAATEGKSVGLVTGEAGAGKTRLVAEVASAAHDAGFVVLHGHCDRDEPIPYQPFAEMVRGWIDLGPMTSGRRLVDRHAEGLQHLVPELAEDTQPGLNDGLPEAARHRMCAAMESWLGEMTALGPVLLVIDDLQWASAATTELLPRLLASSAIQRTSVLATVRSTEVPVAHLASLAAELRRKAVVETLQLGGLSQAEIESLIALHGLVPAPDLAARLQTMTGGNAYMVEEVLRSGVQPGRPTSVPATVRDVILARVADLDPTARRLLTIGAVAGAEFSLREVADAAGIAPEDAVDAADAAIRAGLLADAAGAADRAGFVHDVARTAILAELTEPRRRRLHLALARAGERLHPDPSPPTAVELANHWLGAGAAGEPLVAARRALGAARIMFRQIAHERGVNLLEQALDVLGQGGDHDPCLEAEILTALSFGLQHAPEASTTADATSAARQAGEAAIACGDAAVLTGAVTRFDMVSSGSDGLALCEIALDAIADRAEPAPDLRAEVLITKAVLAAAHHLPGADDLLASAATTGRESTRPFVVSKALNLVAIHHLAGPELGEARSAVEALRHVPWSQHYLATPAFVGLYEAALRLALGDLAGLDATLRAMGPQDREPSTVERVLLSLPSVARAMALGHFERAANMVRSTPRMGGEASLLQVAQQLWLELERGTLEESTTAAIAEAMDAPSLRAPMEAVQNLVRSRAGRVDHACSWLRSRGPALIESPWLSQTAVIVRAFLAELGFRCRDQATAKGLVEFFDSLDAPFVIAPRGVFVWGGSARARGLIAATLEDWPAAVACFEEAVMIEDETGAEPLSAWSRLWWGQALLEWGGATRRREARRLITEAHHAAVRLGMPPVWEEAARLLA